MNQQDDFYTKKRQKIDPPKLANVEPKQIENKIVEKQEVKSKDDGNTFQAAMAAIKQMN